jgi:catechol 2,3-dioxygenase-like lactoylglutathione lyase family enzyme
MMRVVTMVFVGIAFACACSSAPHSPTVAAPSPPAPSSPAPANGAPILGPGSLSLVAHDLAASRTFYEALGFVADPSLARLPGYGQRWLILRAGTTTIGLFQGIPQNTITFHPPDVRALQRHLDARGIQLVNRAPDGTGPAFATALDPDGNPILFDQL